jgi:predicted  nucleic acid-binding Zn-ribbon protein
LRKQATKQQRNKETKQQRNKETKQQRNMWTTELQKIDKSISELRIAIANLELKENKEQEEIDAATAIKAEIERALTKRKKQLFQELEKLHDLTKP